MRSPTDEARLGLIAGILLLGFLLIGAVSASVLFSGTTTTPDSDLEQITNDVLDDLCTVLQIKDVIGSYQIAQGEHTLRHIAIMVRPLISQNIDITQLIVQLSDDEELYHLTYSGKAAALSSYSLFSHPLWENMTTTTYSLAVTIDDDHSMSTNHLINKNTDTAFLLVHLPDDLTMHYGGSLQLTLLPTPGLERTVTLQAPLPTTRIVTLY